MATLQSTGRVTMLRVNERGTKFGPPGDQIDVEAVVQLDSAGDHAFGFQLRGGTNGLAREGMLALLQDAFSHNWAVTIDYELNPGKKNGVLFRVVLCK